ncbi:MAG: Fic family protein [Gemmatimonadales bacterium]
MIFQTPRLAVKDNEVISLIEQAKEQLRHALHAPRVWTGVFRRITLGRAMRGSNSIEGYVIKKADAVAAAAGEQVDAAEDTRRALEAYRRAMTYVLQASKDGTFQYSIAVIKGMHFMMTDYDMSKNPGQWRPGAVFVVDEDKKRTVYEGPPVGMVAPLMDELVDRIAHEDMRIPCVVRAAMAHLNLVMIHPFSDGNGRMARALQTMVLSREGTLWPEFSSVEEYLGAHQREYYDILALVGQGRWHPELSALPWIQFSLKAHFHQAHTLLRRMRENELLYERLDRMVRDAGLAERTALALFDAASGFRVRNGTYRPVADVNEHQASRDLKALVDAGLLLAEGEKRARSYVASPILVGAKQAVEENAPIPDPYAGIRAVTAPATVSVSLGPSLVFNPVPPFSSTSPRAPRRPPGQTHAD